MPSLLYRLCKVVGVPFHLVLDVRASGLEHIPADGPCLLTANHISHFDPPLISLVSSRPIDYMTSAEFFVHPAPAFLLRAAGAFPIDRSRRDLSAVKTTVARLRLNRLVGVFVEGGIRHGARSLLEGAPIGEGTSALAQAERIPLVPALIIGSDRLYQWRYWFKRPKIYVRFGAPFIPEPDEDPRQLAQRLAEKIRGLLVELRRVEKIGEDELPRSAQERWKER